MGRAAWILVCLLVIDRIQCLPGQFGLAVCIAGNGYAKNHQREQRLFNVFVQVELHPHVLLLAG